MVLINIDALSESEIRYIAQQEELEGWESLSREELIDELEELYGDDIHDKENYDPKFVKTIVSTSSDVLDLPGISPIPTSFNTSDIHFIAVDYNWAYAFWNIASHKLKELEDQNAKLSLRVNAKNSEKEETYDFEVSLSDTNWTIELPWEGMTYTLCLIANINGNEETICTGKKIYREKPFFSHHKEILANPDRYRVLVSTMVSKEGSLIDCSAVERIVNDIPEAEK